MHSAPPSSAMLGFGLVDGRPLFLDLAADAYFLLDEGDGDLPAISSPDAPPPDEGRTEALTQAIEAFVPDPIDSVLRLPQPRRSATLLAETWLSLRRARRDLATRPLLDLVAPYATRDPAREVDPLRVLRFAQAVAAVRPLVPQPRHCLTDSLALLRLLDRRRLGATLVFGGKLDPFAAHCWVQSEATLLNDHIDMVRTFTPVLVLPR